MNNNEIMQASLLDILFDRRNKDYGAYVLRRDYNHRLIIAMVMSLTIVSGFLSLNFFTKRSSSHSVTTVGKNTVVVRTYVTPKEKQPQPETIKKKIPATIKRATTDYQTIKIVPDRNDIKNIPTQADLQRSTISDIDIAGPDMSDINIPMNNNRVAGNDSGSKESETVKKFEPKESEAEFPGGQEALMRFLQRNLNAPTDELGAGEKRIVKARFMIGSDGTITGVKIIQSGGVDFDNEVIRVCKKMPRWKPAFQNGTGVAESYILPVTFISVEQ